MAQAGSLCSSRGRMETAVTPHITWVSQNKSSVFPALIFPPVKWTFNDSFLTMRNDQGPQSTVLLIRGMVIVSNTSFWWGWKETQADSLQVHDVPGEPQGKGHRESWQETQKSWECGPDIEHLPSMSKALGLSPSPQEEEKSMQPQRAGPRRVCSPEHSSLMTLTLYKFMPYHHCLCHRSSKTLRFLDHLSKVPLGMDSRMNVKKKSLSLKLLIKPKGILLLLD